MDKNSQALAKNILEHLELPITETKYRKVYDAFAVIDSYDVYAIMQHVLSKIPLQTILDRVCTIMENFKKHEFHFLQA